MPANVQPLRKGIVSHVKHIKLLLVKRGITKTLGTDLNLLTLIAAMSLVGDGRGLLGKGLVPTGGAPGTNLNKKIEKKKITHGSNLIELLYNVLSFVSRLRIDLYLSFTIPFPIMTSKNFV